MVRYLTDKEWNELIDEFEGNDESQPEFAERKGLDLKKFRQRLYKGRREAKKRHKTAAVDVEFVEVSPASSPTPMSPLRIQAGALTLEFDQIPSAAWLAEFVSRSSKESLPC